jgi:hypothetical protein
MISFLSLKISSPALGADVVSYVMLIGVLSAGRGRGDGGWDVMFTIHLYLAPRYVFMARTGTV